MLTQNSPFYTQGLFTPEVALKYDVLSQHENVQDKMRYIEVRVHDIDVTKMHEIRLDFRAQRYLEITKADGSYLPITKLNASFITRIPIYYDPYIGTGILHQTWLTLVGEGLGERVLMVVEPINRTIYYINVNTVSSVNLEIHNISKHAWAEDGVPCKRERGVRIRADSRRHQKRYYKLTESMGLSRTHFIRLTNLHNPAFYETTDLIVQQNREYQFKNHVPVLSPRAFEPRHSTFRGMFDDFKRRREAEARELEENKDLLAVAKSYRKEAKYVRDAVFGR